MQDDEAFDRGTRRAMEDHTPFYVGYLMADGTMCLHDEATGDFPDKPEGCYEQVEAEREARRPKQRVWVIVLDYGYDGQTIIGTAASEDAAHAFIGRYSLEHGAQVGRYKLRGPFPLEGP
jgi:hypothetical protein